MRTQANTYRTGQFSWEPKNQLLMAEASELQIKAGEAPKFLVVKNPNTGNTVGFVRCTQEGDPEEAHGWTYQPGKRSLTKHPRAARVRVLILND